MLKLTVTDAFDAKGIGIWEGWKVNRKKPTFVCLCGEEDEDEHEAYAYEYRVLLHEGDIFFRAKEVPGYWSYSVSEVVNGKLQERHSVNQKDRAGSLAFFARSLFSDGLFYDFMEFTGETGLFANQVACDLFYEEFYGMGRRPLTQGKR